MVDVLVEDKDVETEAAGGKQPGSRWPKGGWRQPLFFALNLLAGGLICLAIVSFRAKPLQDPDASDVAITTDVSAPDQLKPTPVPKVTEVELAEIEAKISDEDRLREGDTRFIAGNYVGAEKYYDRLLETPSLPIATLLYRKALCEEKLNRPEAALDVYPSLLESPYANDVTRHAARLGQARAWLQQRRFDSARVGLLAHLLSADGSPAVLGSTLHQLARLTCDEIRPNGEDWFDDRMVLTDLKSRDEEYLLSLIDETLGKPRTAPGSGAELLDRFSAEPRDMQVRIGRVNTSVYEILRQLAKVGGFEIRYRADIREMLAARTVTVAVEELNMATVLDALLEPCGLTWYMKDDWLGIIGISNVPSDELRTQRIDQSLRLARDALSLFPDHPLAQQTYLCLGNLSFWNGAYADAVSSYRELERRLDGSPQMSVVWHNQAKAFLQLNQRQNARDALFRVVDVARGKQSESVAYLYLGRLYLEDDDTENATRYLARGLARSRDEKGRKIGSVALASGYLLADNPVAANSTLIDHREHLRGDSLEDQAAFLSALARFRATLQPTERLRRAHDLTAALATVEADQFFTSVGYMLIGEAYGEIGLPQQRRNILQAAIDSTRDCEVRRQMMLSLAKMLVDLQDWPAAAAMYSRLEEDSDEKWIWQSRLGRAQLSYNRDEHERCLSECFELIRIADTPDKKATVLKLMGRVYERQHDHYKAALCFAGMLPTIDSDSVRQAILQGP